MGNCCPRRPLSAADFTWGQLATHNVLRRSVQQIMRASPPSGSSNSFMVYVDLFRRFLVTHHHQEDRFIFPEARDKSGNAKLLEREEKEHAELGPLLEELAGLCAKAVGSKSDVVEEVDTTIRQVKTCVGRIGEILEGHLAREEACLTEAFYGAHWDAMGLRALSTKIHDLIPEFMEKNISLVYLVYHLTDEEKVFFDTRLPWILRSILIPRWASRCDLEVWSFAPHPRFDANGNAAYWGTSMHS